MSPDAKFHIIEMAVIGIPLWWGVLKMLFVFREYPPHRHDNGHILYPRGMEPGQVQPRRFIILHEIT